MRENKKSYKERLGLISMYVVILLLLVIFFANNVNAADSENKPQDIVVVMDVSGSMNSLDKDRIVFESIELLMKICDKNDRIAIMTFNDSIVYHSDLEFVGRDNNEDYLVEELSKISYAGETDNGLAMKEAVTVLINNGRTEADKKIYFISDGVTDLAKSNTGRVNEDSYADMNDATKMAVDNDITVYVFGVTNQFGMNMDELTTVSLNTKGEYITCSGPLQLMDSISKLYIASKNGIEFEKDSVSLNTELNRYDISLDTLVENKGQVEKVLLLFMSSQDIIDYETIVNINDSQYEETRHCRIIKIMNPTAEVVNILCRSNTKGIAILSGSRWIKEPEVVIATEEPTKAPTKEPIIYVEPEPIEETNTVQVVLVIVSILVLTILICWLIVNLFFKKNKNKEVGMSGYLTAEFVDLKSKNDYGKICWNLSQSQQEGVTLKELFLSKRINEDLPDMDKVCFYPSDENSILLVHCSEGGVFINDSNISKNVPAIVKPMDIIYVAFPENASEISLRYQLEKEE